MPVQTEETRIIPPSRGGGKKPVLLVSLPYGMCARNFLRSDAHRSLPNSINQIILTPLAEDPAFLRELDKPRVSVVMMPSYGFWARALHRILCEAETAARLREKTTETFRIIEKTIKSGVADPVILDHAGIFSLRSKILSRLPVLREILRRVWLSCCERQAGFLLEKYKPDLVYATHPHSSQDSILAAAAEAHDIPCVAIVHSWDNLTSKRLWVNRYDKIIVWNELMRQQALEFYGFPSEKIFVSGVPQLDSFIDQGAFQDRSSFFRANGWDPDRKLVTFACGSPDFQPDQADILEDLWRAVEAGRFKTPIQLVIRTHPGKTMPGLDRLHGKPHIHIHAPSAAYGALVATSGWAAGGNDQSFFMNLVKHSDVFINCFSTTTIEAAALDRPIINIAFDGRRKLDYLSSCIKHYDFSHYKPIVDSQGVGIARSQKDLEDLIEAYLNDPAMDRVGRHRIVSDQCGELDGKAGRRVADLLSSQMEKAAGLAKDN